jgi:hypothetical protein
MPYNGFSGLSIRFDRCLVENRDYNTGVGDFRYKTTITANHATDLGADFLGILQGTYQISADIPFIIPTA